MSWLPGLDGHLISTAVLDKHLLESAAAHPDNRLLLVRRTLIKWRTQTGSMGPASSLRMLQETGAQPLVEALGFSRPIRVAVRENWAIGTVAADHQTVTLIVAPWGARLDSLWRVAIVEARQLGAAWALLFNGTHIRLLEAARAHSRRYVQFDLDLAIDDDKTFGAFWATLNASAFAGSETAAGAFINRLVRQSEQHASAVCRSLRDGVLQASHRVLSAICGRSRGAPLQQSFEQALTIVYRILFLLFAEARDLVPLWHPIYRRSYSVEALREAAEAPVPVPGFWEALRASCRLAHGGCVAGDLRVTPFNGRLFAPAYTPLADRRDLDDGAARQAILALSTRSAPDGAGRERITYRDLGVEQLGAVYESLLDYEPRVASDSRARRTVTLLRSGSGRRKATGTFYTPQSIAHYLVRQTLGPLVRGKSPDEILGLRVLDPSVGSGAFLVAAAAFLSETYQESLIESGGCHPTDFGPSEQALVRRTITERCLYGVDLNPMAVQLARLSLWLASLAADRPLSFLDHHLLTGNSLIGAWVGTLKRATPINRRKKVQDLPLFPDVALTAALQSALPTRFRLAIDDSATPAQVRQKERALAELNHPDSSLSKWRRIADLWCARWFTGRPCGSGVFSAVSDWLLGDQRVPARTIRHVLDDTQAAANARAFFHWELEFPEIFFDEKGDRLARPGFDAVIGNPPWDMIRADSGADEQRSQTRKDELLVLRFVRDAGAYSVATLGHANRYQLFLERAIALTREGGRLGLVLPHGMAADHGSAPLRRFLFNRCNVDTLVGFDNRRAIFPIHRSVRFLLLTGTSGQQTTEIRCRLGLTDPAALESLAVDDAATPAIRVTPALLEKIGGADLPIPDLHSPVDLAIAERAAAMFPPLESKDGWSVHFGRELNATEDRPLFNSMRRGLPVIEGKQIEPFRTNLEGCRLHVDQRIAERRLGHVHARLAYRDVASRSNRLTLIAAILPAGCVSTHTVFCLRASLPLRAQQFLCALFNSYVLNFLVRLRVTTHVTTKIVGQLPVPKSDEHSEVVTELAQLATRLARRADRSASSRLQARVAKLYQLSDEEFAHVLSSFPLIAREERDEALNEFRNSR